MYPFHIAELIYPGYFLIYPSNNTSVSNQNANLSPIIGALENALYEVAISLTFFEETRHLGRMRRITEPDYEAHWNERLFQIMSEIEPNIPVDNLIMHRNYQQIREQAEIQVRQEQWKSGRMPESYERQMKFIYAKSFIYALERIKKLFDALLAELKNPIEEQHVLETVQTVRRDFREAFPNLVGVRDTTAHFEDRIRSLKKRGLPLDLKPLSIEGFEAPQGALILDQITGNRYGGIMVDGEYGEIEISAQSLEIVQNFIQTTIDAFQWQGERHSSLR